ncbi:RHS repeat-associated core domain-containing protein|uniref:RHS repeat-associated core domain-containing protein n=1 Tax=Pseudomonas sp. SbOxS1 TaxID=2723884 RepID=UPI0015D35F97|nr:RHS repeat-associated core domain-containing protein [Pseudomonas sp. SbOxS1]NYU06893.1 RHS repeat-associated core domain-containing protein [Pseudomonas sp. SbOxS1]
MLASDDKNSVMFEVDSGDRQDIAYSPYGHSVAGSGALGYNGELREARTGWYLLGNGYRAFNPLLMRFHSPDSWSPFGAGGLNTYMYCLGDPVRHKDETGHMVNPAKTLSWIKQAKLDAAAEVAGTAFSSAATGTRTVATTVGEAVESTSRSKGFSRQIDNVSRVAPPTPEKPPTLPPKQKSSAVPSVNSGKAPIYENYSIPSTSKNLQKNNANVVKAKSANDVQLKKMQVEKDQVDSGIKELNAVRRRTKEWEDEITGLRQTSSDLNVLIKDLRQNGAGTARR